MLTLNSNLLNGLRLTGVVWEVKLKKEKVKRQKKRLGAHISPFLGYPEVSETKRGGENFPLGLYRSFSAFFSRSNIVRLFSTYPNTMDI